MAEVDLKIGVETAPCCVKGALYRAGTSLASKGNLTMWSYHITWCSHLQSLLVPSLREDTGLASEYNAIFRYAVIPFSKSGQP